MNPIDFALWLNGATQVLGGDMPTPEQWERMKERLANTVGQIVASKLLEGAEELRISREHDREKMQKMAASFGYTSSAVSAMSAAQRAATAQQQAIDSYARKTSQFAGTALPPAVIELKSGTL